MKTTQHKIIIDYLKEHKKLTRFTALVKLGVSNLPSRVQELKAQGFNIVAKKTSTVNRYGRRVHFNEYYLIEESTSQNQGFKAQ